ncbi:unnamed protein product [Ceratitis capitata]|uniref:(Mediterranean fruit fly) hypothetical protein n=1 Tax=Ceratitis capitata TaxID=7213 RepID=A0A811VDZ4_CERCA|nr:unnamed protein product [Ceratitis capitata]
MTHKGLKEDVERFLFLLQKRKEDLLSEKYTARPATKSTAAAAVVRRLSACRQPLLGASKCSNWQEASIQIANQPSKPTNEQSQTAKQQQQQQQQQQQMHQLTNQHLNYL